MRIGGEVMDLLDLFCKITLDDDDYKRGLDDAKKHTGSAEKSIVAFAKNARNALENAAKIAQKLDSAISKVGSTSIKGLVGAAATGGAALVALWKSALDAYGNYEQLVGGVDTLFKDASEDVQKYAANAYKTAGLSANAYMETATGFAASLIQSLGGDTEKAAKYADIAISDMSDNANKMGTAMESIQNAYQGFAKQNYTMLDNLKLGYGGTKEEMERLLSDANKLNAAQGKYTEYSIDSYADIVSAIHDVQVNLDITGTTAKEAATTIQGSIASAKAAYSNFATALAIGNDDAIEKFDILVDSIATAAGNLVPRIKEILPNIATAISKALEISIKTIPTIANDMIPAAIDGVMRIVDAILAAAPSLVDALAPAADQILTGLFSAFDNAQETILPLIRKIVPQIADAFIRYQAEIRQIGIQIITAIAQGLADSAPELATEALNGIKDIAYTISESFPVFVDAMFDIIDAVVDALPEAFASIVGILPDLVQQIITKLTDGDMIRRIIAAGVEMLSSLADNVGAIVENIADALPAIVDGVTGALADLIPTLVKKLIPTAVKSGAKLGAAIVQSIPKAIVNTVVGIAKTTHAAFESLGEALFGVTDELGIDMLELTAAEKRNREECERAIKAREELIASYRDNAVAVDEEAARTEDLWRELQTLTDAEGHVSEANQERAQYLLHELNDALGTEYSMNEGIIGQYKDMQLEIDALIQKRRAERLLANYEAIYQSAQDSKQKQEQARQTAKEKYDDAVRQQQAMGTRARRAGHAMQYERDYFGAEEYGYSAETLNAAYTAATAYDEAGKIVSDKRSQYEAAAAAMDRTQAQIYAYEQAMTAVLAGNYETATNYLTDVVDTSTAMHWQAAAASGKISEDEKNALAENLKFQERQIAYHYQQMMQGNKSYTASELDNMTSYFSDCLASWKKMTGETYAIGDNIVAALAEGIKDGESIVAGAAAQVANAALDEMKNVAEIRSPSRISRALGQFISQGLALGIEDDGAAAQRAAATVMENTLSEFGATPGIGTYRRANSSGGSVDTPINISITVHADTDDLGTKIANEIETAVYSVMAARGNSRRDGRTAYAY